MAGDMRDVWDAFKEDARERREDRIEKNMAAIEASGLDYEERPSALLFRNPGKPKVDFYPGTGRWVVCGAKRARRGGADAFLSWYAKQDEARMRKEKSGESK